MSKQVEIQAPSGTPSGNGTVTPTAPPVKVEKTPDERIADGYVAGVVNVARKVGGARFLAAHPDAIRDLADVAMAGELAGVEARLASPRYLVAKRALKSALSAK
jgi:hypothetical protein